MDLEVLSQHFSVCKVKSLPSADDVGDFVFIGRTDRELSLVCETDRTPADCILREDGWRCLRVKGELDFSLVGVLAAISGLLARHHISIFAVSTYDTDYILVRESHLALAVGVLRDAGYGIKTL